MTGFGTVYIGIRRQYLHGVPLCRIEAEGTIVLYYNGSSSRAADAAGYTLTQGRFFLNMKGAERGGS